MIALDTSALVAIALTEPGYELLEETFLATPLIVGAATYAVAKVAGVPLLFKGDDFSRTDIVAALPT